MVSSIAYNGLQAPCNHERVSGGITETDRELLLVLTSPSNLKLDPKLSGLSGTQVNR